MKLSHLALAVALCLPLAATAQPTLPTKAPARPAAPTVKDPVATVNGVAIPKARSDALVRQQAQRGQADSADLRGAVREELINREILAQEAARAGISKRPEVQAQIDAVRQEIVVGTFVNDWLRKNPVTDAEVQSEYERVKGASGDREYKARHILVKSEDQAKSLIADLKKGSKFEDLAKQHSEDTGSKPRGGDLDWNVPGTFVKEFAEALVKLEKGKVTEAPVKSQYGFHVIRLDDVRQAQFPPLAQVKGQIQKQIQQQKLQAYVTQLRAKAKVE
ncbi:MAG: peptidylprolyl isomerase [Burkholderiales bacterium]